MSETTKWAPISVLGAALITRDLLKKFKTSNDDDEDSFINKMNGGMKFSNRLSVVATALMFYGPTEKCVKFIKKCRYFSDVDENDLLDAIKKIINNLSNGETIYEFDPREVGTMDFSQLPELDPDPLDEDDKDNYNSNYGDNFN